MFTFTFIVIMVIFIYLFILLCRPGSDLTALPAQLLQPPASHSPVLRKTHSHPHPATAKSSGSAAASGGGKRQTSPPSAASYHPRAQSIPTGSGITSTGDAAMAAATAERLKTDEHKSRSKSGSPRQVDY